VRGRRSTAVAPRLGLVLAVLALACGGDAPAGGVNAPLADGTFARIQRDILDPGCATCHTSGTAGARQSGLVLTADSAYQQLVGVASRWAVARDAGVMRVKPFRADSSLLYHKLAWTPGHHGANYGNLMPMGTTQGLTQGELEYVRRWIEAGAPRAGHVVDAGVLADRRTQVAEFTPLAAPATGRQLTVDRFSVAPGFEREFFTYRRLGNAEPLYVTRIETRMRPGSHHLLVQTFDERETAAPCDTRPAPDVIRDIRQPDGALNFDAMRYMGCHRFFAGAMTPSEQFTFPPGVALMLPPDAALDLNVHYVNRTPAAFPGEAMVNLHTTEAANVRQVARTLTYGNTNITLPPGQRTTLTRTFSTSARLTVLALTSHMHELGERFEIRVRRAGGAVSTVYVSTDYAHPEFRTFETPLVLEAGDALQSVITWNNTTTRTVRFGLASTDEMGIIFGYAY
jgi:hypothetical protein